MCIRATTHTDKKCLLKIKKKKKKRRSHPHVSHGNVGKNFVNFWEFSNSSIFTSSSCCYICSSDKSTSLRSSVHVLTSRSVILWVIISLNMCRLVRGCVSCDISFDRWINTTLSYFEWIFSWFTCRNIIKFFLECFAFIAFTKFINLIHYVVRRFNYRVCFAWNGHSCGNCRFELLQWKPAIIYINGVEIFKRA